MSAYEIALLWGSLMSVGALLAGLSAYSNKAPYWITLLFLGIGSGLVYYAYTLNGQVVDPRDIPVAIYRFIGVIIH